MLLDTTTDCVHTLNATMTAVWKLCDGKRSIDDIARELEESFECSEVDDLGDATRTALEQLAGLDLLATTSDDEGE